jgi:hypothetical protein
MLLLAAPLDCCVASARVRFASEGGCAADAMHDGLRRHRRITSTLALFAHWQPVQ